MTIENQNRKMVDIKRPGRCPRCGGNEILEKEDGEWEFVCIQCGRRRGVSGTPPPAYVNENCFTRGQGKPFGYAQGKRWGYRRTRSRR
jgi:hypothetical protein